MKPFLLEPLDILFFRDGRPMAAGQGTGHGCRLPLPSTLHEALRTSLLSTTDFAPGQGGRGTRDKRSDRDFEGNTAFQSLRTRGPFLHGFRQHQPGESDEAWEIICGHDRRDSSERNGRHTATLAAVDHAGCSLWNCVVCLKIV